MSNVVDSYRRCRGTSCGTTHYIIIRCAMISFIDKSAAGPVMNRKLRERQAAAARAHKDVDLIYTPAGDGVGSGGVNFL